MSRWGVPLPFEYLRVPRCNFFVTSCQFKLKLLEIFDIFMEDTIKGVLTSNFGGSILLSTTFLTGGRLKPPSPPFPMPMSIYTIFKMPDIL